MKSWKDISLRKAIELESLGEMEKLDLIINQYAILNDMTIDEVEKMTPNELFESSKDYQFILKMPDAKKTDIVKVKGRKYGMVDFSKMTLAQMVDIEEYYNEGVIENAHKILSVIMLPVRRNIPFTKVVLEDYNPDPQREEDFLDLDMEMVWGNLLFFYHIEMKYMKDLLGYLQVQLKTASQYQKSQEMEELRKQVEKQ
jgi:hypothetical protein